MNTSSYQYLIDEASGIGMEEALREQFPSRYEANACVAFVRAMIREKDLKLDVWSRHREVFLVRQREEK